ncbi:hypothetical protein GC105_02565 [Alkalibaculum sp. M08DMB]|uniref:Uncharacterized protein n=1 Tax=Alkalibaculum sporogenes TaxID=2655001 RepID=A0A6A7K632_9FIRM|nr:hypothetical protein [Alkalibaculum sporogenes]MPW24677.1 hypothetical protein [Alkalibaculum sporogenes]
MDRVVITVLALIAAGVVMSLLLSRYVRKKWVWYIPSVIGVFVITYYSLKIQFENLDGHEELGYIILILMMIAVMIGNLLTNVLINLRRRTKKKKRFDEENTEEELKKDE